MDSVVTSPRPFIPGTTGWTVADLDDPETAARWDRGRFEIVEGVLTTMPAAYYLGGRAMQKLIRLVEDFLIHHNLPGDFSTEADIVINSTRVVCADAALLTDADTRRQEQAVATSGRSDSERIRILVPPTLIIESVSPGHELHDLRTKYRWYAEFGVPNYWVLNYFARTLECHRLDGKAFRLDTEGRDQDQLRPSAFPGLVIPLEQLWKRRGQ